MDKLSPPSVLAALSLVLWPRWATISPEGLEGLGDLAIALPYKVRGAWEFPTPWLFTWLSRPQPKEKHSLRKRVLELSLKRECDCS